MTDVDAVELARQYADAERSGTFAAHNDAIDLARAVLELAAERDAARNGEDTWFKVGENLARENLELTADRDRLRAALREACEIIDDLNWRGDATAELTALRAIADGGER